MPSLALALGAVLLAAAPALARTDLQGCTYYDSVVVASNQAPYATRIYYVPDTGELCDFLDCGGGRAPPKTTVPGCPQYKGTETYSPSFINPKTLGRAGAGSSAPATTTTAAAAGTDTVSAMLTTEVRTTAAPSVTGAASGSGSGAASSSSGAVAGSGNNSEASKPGASSSSPASGGDKASVATGTTATHTAAAAGMPTAGAVMGPVLLAGVAAGMGLF